MDFRLQLACSAVGLAMLLLVTHSLRRNRLYPGFAVLWAGIGAVLLFLPAYSGVLQWAADNVFGIVGANHLIYALLFTFMLLDLFYLTEKLCRMNNQVERLIVSLAILEADARANAEKHTAASVPPGAAPENRTCV